MHFNRCNDAIEVHVKLDVEGNQYTFLAEVYCGLIWGTLFTRGHGVIT